ncbi:MAG TPA: S41 family peptidase [Candidatus Omnitrophota bacterium]|nr:S41 family peptidase [Candidatus Omnitrophota bacterium]HRZ15148.1 S41 family peptidase [Candidatus Omnitrophota bacterium]
MLRKILVGSLLIAIALGISTITIPAMEKGKTDLFKQVELFSDSLAIVQTEYVDEVKPKDLIYGALKGMLSALDPHSQFMDPDTYNELKVDTEGKFGGLGIEITIKDGLLTVVTPIQDTPAWKAGLKAKDRIVKINGELTRDITLTDAVKKLRGKPGEPVTVTILRESEHKLLDIKIVRDVIKIQDIKNPRILSDGIGYVRLVEFRENTVADLTTTLQKLKKEGMVALIIDLRNNPGGLLDSAIGVAEKFVERGKLIVSTKGRKSQQNMEFTGREASPLLDLPMVILINEGSASGSEIVAGALQDYKRAIIVGTKSFGKGSVQTVIPLSDGSALRLTTSKYFTPSGKVIHGNGVIPDIVVEEQQPATEDDEKEEAKGEEVFDRIDDKNKQPQVKPQDDLKSDTQLMRAVDILKAVQIYKKISQK